MLRCLWYCRVRYRSHPMPQFEHTDETGRARGQARNGPLTLRTPTEPARGGHHWAARPCVVLSRDRTVVPRTRSAVAKARTSFPLEDTAVEA